MFGLSGSGSNGIVNYKLGNNESRPEVASCIKVGLGFSLTFNIVVYSWFKYLLKNKDE